MNGDEVKAYAQELCDFMQRATTPSEVHHLRLLMLQTPGCTNATVLDEDGISVRLTQVAGMAQRRTAGIRPPARTPLPRSHDRGSRHPRRAR